jgi:hypothetical protein
MKTVIKENESFRLTLSKEPCLLPQDMQTIEMIQEQLKDGRVVETSTYQFFMNEHDINKLVEALAR